jgi:hypothetical protein
MARAEDIGLSAFFGTLGKGAERFFLQKEQKKAEEESALKQTLAALYAKQAEKGLLEREIEVPGIPQPPRPELPLLLSQRLGTGVPPEVEPRPPVISPPTTERRPLTAEEQIELFKSIYGEGRIPAGIKTRRIEDIAAAKVTPVFFVDPATKRITTQEGIEVTGAVPKGAKFITEKEPPKTEQEKLEFQAKRKELATSLQMLPKLDQAVTAIGNLKAQFFRGFTPKSIKEGDVKGALKEQLRGLKARVESVAGARAELGTYLADREAFSSLISKGGFMEAGMLTNQDIQRVLTALPKPGESIEKVNAKWRELEGILSSARKRFENRYKTFTGKEYSAIESTSFPTREIEPITRTEYNIGDIITAPNNKRYRVIGFYDDGEPNVVPVE